MVCHERYPCLVRRAGVARSGERTTATLAQVEALAEAVAPRYRLLILLILLAAWSGARWGELVALSRDRLDLERGIMWIDRQYVELEDNSLVSPRLSGNDVRWGAARPPASEGPLPVG